MPLPPSRRALFWLMVGVFVLVFMPVPFRSTFVGGVAPPPPAAVAASVVPPTPAAVTASAGPPPSGAPPAGSSAGR